MRIARQQDPATIVFGEQCDAAAVRLGAIGIKPCRRQLGDVGLAQNVLLFLCLLDFVEPAAVSGRGRPGDDAGLAAGRVPHRLEQVELALCGRQQGEPKYAAKIGFIDLLCLGEITYRRK